MWGIRPHHQNSAKPGSREAVLRARNEREPGVFDPVGSTLKFGQRREAPLTTSPFRTEPPTFDTPICLYNNLRMSKSSSTLDVAPMSRLFKALGDDSRLRIVALLAHGELCVCHVEEALKLSQPNASRQLSVLRNAGVVESRRDGTWVYYSLAPQRSPECEQLLKSLVDSFAKRTILKRDHERLIRTRGPNSCK